MDRDAHSATSEGILEILQGFVNIHYGELWMSHSEITIRASKYDHVYGPSSIKGRKTGPTTIQNRVFQNPKELGGGPYTRNLSNDLCLLFITSWHHVTDSAPIRSPCCLNNKASHAVP